jgi:hypothetical protein
MMKVPDHLYRVSQEECAKLRGSVPYVKIYRYNPKYLYPKLNGYGDNGQRKLLSSCGSTYCTCSADRVTCTLRMPVLESCIAANVRLRYERLVSCTESAVPSEREVLHVYAHAHMPCKMLGNPKDNYGVNASVYVVQFNGFMSLIR